MGSYLTNFRVLIKLAIFVFLIFFFFLFSFFIYFFFKDPERRRYKYTQNATFFCNLMIHVMGVRVLRKGKIPSAKSRFLYVSNHVGFLDVLVSNSQFPMFFITSLDIKNTPFLGLLTDFGGCLYVDRNNRANIQEELAEMVDYLKAGYKVVLYPEATSSNAEQVLPFKRTLLSAAVLADVPIQPVVFNVLQINGEPFSLKWRDHVCWYGDIPFVTSLLRLFSLKEVVVELIYLPRYKPSAWDNRKIVAEEMHRQISEKFKPVRKKLF